MGKRVIKNIVCNYPDVDVVSLSRTEYRLSELLVETNDARLSYIVGDIRDNDAVKYAMKDVDYVIHTAALKHVDLCEQFPSEAISINVWGTQNLLENFNGDAFVFMSSDKAERPVGCYGASKLLSEKLVFEYSTKYEDRRYCVVRSGNIFGSSGSVIEKWFTQIKNSNEIMVTDLDMTRFFISSEDVAEFVVNTLFSGKNSGVYVPEMNAIRIGDLAEIFIKLYGNADTVLKVVGMRKGEKIHETLNGKRSETAKRLTESEIIRWLDELKI